MKRLAQITLTIVSTLLCFLLLWEFRPALELFGGSLALSATLRPLVRRLEERGIARGYAILIWYVLLLALIAAVVFVFGLGISGEIAQTLESFPAWYANLRAELAAGGTITNTINQSLPDLSGALEGGLPPALIGGTAAGLVGGLVGQIVLLLAMLSLAFYWLMEATHFERLWLSLMPVGTRIRAREIWRNAEEAVGVYVRSTLVAVLFSGLLLLGAYRLIEFIPGVGIIPFAAALALIGGLSHLVPRIGPAAVLLFTAAIVAMISIGAALAVVVCGIVIHVAAHHVADRMIVNSVSRVNPLLQVLVLLALAEIGGLSAIVFGPPLAALIQVLNNSLRASGAEQPSEQQALDRLHERLQLLQANADPERKEYLNALRRSQELMSQARQILNET